MFVENRLITRTGAMLLVSIALHKILMTGMQAPEPVSIPGVNALAVNIVLKAAAAAPAVEKKKPPVIKPYKKRKSQSVKKNNEVKQAKKTLPVKKKKAKIKPITKPPVKQEKVAKMEQNTMPKSEEQHSSPPPISAADKAKKPQPEAPLLVLNPNYRQPPEPPEYPKRARRLRQQGIVLVRALVTPTGSVEKVKVFNSSSHPLLDKSALAAVLDWEFVPARNNGQPVASWVQVPVNFVLN